MERRRAENWTTRYSLPGISSALWCLAMSSYVCFLMDLLGRFSHACVWRSELLGATSSLARSRQAGIESICCRLLKCFSYWIVNIMLVFVNYERFKLVQIASRFKFLRWACFPIHLYTGNEVVDRNGLESSKVPNLLGFQDNLQIRAWHWDIILCGS